MSKELVINLDDALYADVIESVGEQNVNRFIESAVRFHLEKNSSEVYDVNIPAAAGIHTPHLKYPSRIKELKIEMIEDEKSRPFGLAEGDFVVPDDFDAPLPEEVLASFER